MKSMAVNEQMELALNESGRKDPVSGNDVPIGSLPEEVRDDVPAMLSEGEYVVPADVLRFYGLKFFEDLRMYAKREIARMADEGRIGGEPIAGPQSAASAPDQPISNGLDLSPEDMQQLELVLQSSEGGAVGFNLGGMGMEQNPNKDKMQQGIIPSNKASMNIEDDAKTDQLIDRIINSVQNNPNLQDKLAKKGIGFMEGGAVGFNTGGDQKTYTADEWLSIMQKQQLGNAFNPYAFLTPGTGGGFGGSNFKTAESIVDAVKPAPVKEETEEERIARRMSEAEDPNNPSGKMGPTFDTMTDEDVLSFSGLLSKVSPTLAENFPGLQDRMDQVEFNQKQADVYEAGVPDGYQGGTAAENEQRAAEDLYGSEAGPPGTSENDAASIAYGSDFAGYRKGAFISRRKKT
jgi:hypothetical protein